MTPICAVIVDISDVIEIFHAMMNDETEDVSEDSEIVTLDSGFMNSSILIQMNVVFAC